MPKADNKTRGSDLPLDVTPASPPQESNTQIRRFKLPRLAIFPLVFLILFTGAVVGIVVQPPLLRIFLNATGLQPGSGTSEPIAVPVAQAPAPEIVEPEPTPTLRAVVALGKLQPEGDVVTVALPYGAGDARIEQVLVTIGQKVIRGDVLARLDNTGPLQSALGTARANLALREATLDQTRAAISASRDEARAALERAQVTADVANSSRLRTQDLFDRGVTTGALLDEAIATAQRTVRDVEKAQVTLSRYASEDINSQPDVVVAARNVDTARADMARASQDLARGIVTAPLTGTVLDIHTKAGEKPGSGGVADIGNIAQMTAVLEVYQSEIATISVGQPVELSSDALNGSLTGLVSDIGYSVKRQSQISDDPAANTDARVVEVSVRLDEESSARAERLTHLEVTARITVEQDGVGPNQ